MSGRSRAFFAYASNPPDVAESISTAIESINASGGSDIVQATSWTSLNNRGKLMLSEITSAIQGAEVFAADLTVLNPESFSIRLGEVRHFTVENIVFDHPVIRPNQDGVHVGGFSEHGYIRNLRAATVNTTSDDMVALNADDDVQRVLNPLVHRTHGTAISSDGTTWSDGGIDGTRMISWIRI